MLLDRSSAVAFSIVAEMASPNSDIDANEPRTRPDRRGYISDKCIKRRLRDILETDRLNIAKEMSIDADRLHIFESLFRGFNVDCPREAAKMGRALFVQGKAKERYFDVRLFGAMALDNADKDENGDAVDKKNKKEDDASNRRNQHEYVVKGCCQVAMPVSLHPVDIITAGCSKKFPLRGEFLEKRQGDLAPAAINVVAFGLYYGMIFINAVRGRQNGVSNEDVTILQRMLPRLFVDKGTPQAGVYVVQAISAEHTGVNPSFNEFAFRQLAEPQVKNPSALTASIDDYQFPTVESIQSGLGKKAKVSDLLLHADGGWLDCVRK